MDKLKEQVPIGHGHGPHGEGCECPNQKYVIEVDYTNPDGVVVDLVGQKPMEFEHAVRLVGDLDEFVRTMARRLVVTKLAQDILEGGVFNAANDSEVN